VRNSDFLREDSHFSIAVRDPVWKNIWLTPAFREITLSAPFLRLYRIKQLGPAEFVYPGATHTRAAHSFGVYHLALKLLRVLVSRGADSWVSETGCISFLAAALLHDLGHFPFTHALKELPLEDHETLTAMMITSEPLSSLISKAGGDPYMTAAIVDKKSTASPEAGTETLFFRHLLSGVLDPDKLDYLNRDAFFCGVPYGIQDTDFIMSRIQPDRTQGVVVDSRAIMSIESILFSKYLMYRSVYWHKQVRITTAMMKKTLFAALERKILRAEQLYSLDDSGIFTLIDSLDFPEKVIANALRERLFFQIIGEFQFDRDNTAMTKLESLAYRSGIEHKTSDFLSAITGKKIQPDQILIDIPERITFESDLFISDEKKIFSESSTVFTHDIVQNFTTMLRKIRIAVHPVHSQSIHLIPDLDEKLAKCLDLVYTE
jgi:HD superfamily phosphohydrolase